MKKENNMKGNEKKRKKNKLVLTKEKGSTDMHILHDVRKGDATMFYKT